MVGDDPSRATEPLECREAKHVGTARAFDVPKTLHDDLEVRGLDTGCGAVPVRHAVAAKTVPDPPAPDLAGDGQYQRVLDADVLPGQLGEPLDRADDRRTRGAVVEPLQPEDVSVQRRDPSEKPVERREGVLPDHKDRVDPKRRADHVRQVALEVRRELVVEEVLLGLIEDQVDVARELSPLEDVPEGARPRGRRRRRRPLPARPRDPRPSGRRRLRSAPPGSARSLRATEARSSDDFPTPLGP